MFFDIEAFSKNHPSVLTDIYQLALDRNTRLVDDGKDAGEVREMPSTALTIIDAVDYIQAILPLAIEHALTEAGKDFPGYLTMTETWNLIDYALDSIWQLLLLRSTIKDLLPFARRQTRIWDYHWQQGTEQVVFADQRQVVPFLSSLLLNTLQRLLPEEEYDEEEVHRCLQELLLKRLINTSISPPEVASLSAKELSALRTVILGKLIRAIEVVNDAEWQNESQLLVSGSMKWQEAVAWGMPLPDFQSTVLLHFYAKLGQLQSHQLIGNGGDYFTSYVLEMLRSFLIEDITEIPKTHLISALRIIGQDHDFLHNYYDVSSSGTVMNRWFRTYRQLLRHMPL